MIITSISTVVGFSILQEDLYVHCLLNSEEFRQIIKDEYFRGDEDSFTFEQFRDHICAHFGDVKFPELNAVMCDLMYDSMYDLERVKYPGTTFSISCNRYRREQEDMNYGSCIVGIEILHQEVRNVTGDGGLEISTVMDMGQKLVKASEEIANFPGLMKYDIKLFPIMNGC